MCGCPLPLVSDGCKFCWSRSLHNQRHKALLAGKKLPEQYRKPFEEIQLFPDRLNEPLRVKKPCQIAVGLMGDLFAAPFEFIDKVMAVIALCPQHTFQVLTKRVERMAEYFEAFDIRNLTPKYKHWPYSNLHLGVSICTQEDADRMLPIFLKIPAAKRIISFEPLLERVDTHTEGRSYLWDNTWVRKKINQLIIGSESKGRSAGRYCPVANVRDLVQQGKAAGVKIFVKQLDMWKVDDHLFETEEDGQRFSHYWCNMGHIKKEIKPKLVLVKKIEDFPADLQIREDI